MMEESSMEDVLISVVSPEVRASNGPNEIEETLTNGVEGKHLEEPVLVDSQLIEEEQPEVKKSQHLQIEHDLYLKEQDANLHEQEQR